MNYGTVKFSPPNIIGGREVPGVWTIACEPHVTERLKRIFLQVKQNKTGDIVLTATPEVSKDLLWALSRWPMELSQTAERVLRESAAKYDDSLARVESILAGGTLSPTGHWPVLEPYDYQRVGSDVILAVGRIILGDDVGLGKTLTALLTMRDYEALPLLVVCEVHVQLQWQREIQKFFPMVNSHIIKKGSVYNVTNQRGYHGHAPEVYIISYHKLDGWASHFKGIIRTVVFDEAQQLRRTETNRYLAAQIVSESAIYVVGTTASPVYNYGGEAHSVIDVIRPGALGTRQEFTRAWGREGTNDKVIVTDPKALGSYLRSERILFRRTRKDVGKELPPVVTAPHVVDCDEGLLDQALEEYGTLAAASMIVTNSGTQKERYAARGDIDWQMRKATGLAKAKYVTLFTEMLLQTEDKIILALWHRDVYDVYVERLNQYNPVLFSGSESPKQKDLNFRRFVEDDECRLLLMSLRSGAGLNGLQGASHVVVFGELDWSPKMHDQLIGRLNRDGMDVDNPVIAFYLHCLFGSDPLMMEILGIKRGQSEPIIDPDVDMLSPTAMPEVDRIRLLAETALRRGKVAR